METVEFPKRICFFGSERDFCLFVWKQSCRLRWILLTKEQQQTAELHQLIPDLQLPIRDDVQKNQSSADLLLLLLLLQQRSPGKGLFDLVCAHLNLTEADYFGLEYQDHRKMTVRRRRCSVKLLKEASADLLCNAWVCLLLQVCMAALKS